MDYHKLTKELKHKERTIEDLISYISTRTDDNVPNYSLLLGAGASFTSGITTGENLVSKWRQEIYCKLAEDNDYQEDKAKQYLITNHSNWYSLSNEYSSLFEHKFDLPSQRRRFVEQEVDKKLPSIGYSYLVSLSKDRYFDTIYTTNFDDLLNESFYQFSQTRPIVCAHDSSVNTISVTSERPKIIKLHGDYLFDDIKSTLRETESLEVNIKEKLIQFSKEYGLIVMGYAGNDRSIMDVINYLLKSESYLKNGIYWCIREGDKLNPELTKLLWKDRVYFVKIDGFDEVVAKIHHALKENFSLKENFTNSKKEKIIAAFTQDTFKLSNSSSFIKKDIEELRKHKDSMDISNLIRELNEKEFDGSEDDFKVLLSVDRLVSDKNYSDAINLIKNHIDNFDSHKSKQIYFRKMIKIYDLAGQSDQAISLCDQLIELDPYKIENFFLKGSKIKNLTDRCRFIQENIDKYNNSYHFHNYLFNNAIAEKENVKGKSFFSIETINNHIKRSLTQEPSISNPAYRFQMELIEQKYKDKIDKKNLEEKKSKLNELLEKLKDINEKHLEYIKITLNPSFFENDYSKAKASVENAISVCKQSSLSKKHKIVSLICDKFPDFHKLEGTEELKADWTNFMQSDLIQELDSPPVSVLVCKAKFQLQIERDKEKCIEFILKAKNHKDAHEKTGSIVSYLINVAGDILELKSFIDENSDEFSMAYLDFYKSELFSAEKRYDEAIDLLDTSYRNGLSLDEYITRKSYILLKAEKYQKVINLVDSNIKFLEAISSKDILTINRETASSKLNKGINEISLRNVIGRKLSPHLVLAAECLVGKKVNAIRLINAAIENDYFDYFAFRHWPVIPENYLSEINVPETCTTQKTAKVVN